jgi:hypothetical protein
MHTRKTDVIVSFVVSIIFFFQCRTAPSYIPERHENISLTDYNKYKDKLLQAYQKKDDYSVAVQLANLKASNNLVFKQLNQAVNKDVACCNAIFEMQNIAEQGFFQNLYKADTVQFKQVIGLCLQKLGKNAYDDYLKQYQKEVEIYQKSKPQIDSSSMKRDLILILQKINDDDQKYRRELSDFRITEAEKNSFSKLQNKLDSSNLIRVDSILTNHGYPRPQEVGFDLSMTIFLVLHHQSNIAVREKYLPIIRDKLSENQIELFVNRTQTIKDNEENKN